MTESIAILLAALIGGIIASVGNHLLTRRREEERTREELVQQHLFQLQDATESLWYRLHNLAFRQGIDAMRDPWYFKFTTLYSLGKLLAVERIFALEGIYPQLDAVYGEAKLGKFLREHRTDLELRGITKFQQYDRIFLAEAAIEGEQRERFRASTFVEFVKRYESTNSPEKERLDLIWRDIKNDETFWRRMVELLEHLHEFAQRILEDTGLRSHFLNKYDENRGAYDKQVAKLKDDEAYKDSIVASLAGGGHQLLN